MPQSFENMFSKYNKNGDGTLTLGELFKMIKGHRCAADPFGVRSSCSKLLLGYWIADLV